MRDWSFSSKVPRLSTSALAFDGFTLAYTCDLKARDGNPITYKCLGIALAFGSLLSAFISNNFDFILVLISVASRSVRAHRSCLNPGLMNVEHENYYKSNSSTYDGVSLIQPF